VRVQAFIVKTAKSRAMAEDGKYSESYAIESTFLLVNPDDMTAWNFKDGIVVACNVPGGRDNVLLVVKSSRNVRRNTVNLVESAWIKSISRCEVRSVEIEITFAPGSKPLTLEEAIKTPAGCLK
jgi:formylmethanofuran dehydrogenase subunit D